MRRAMQVLSVSVQRGDVEVYRRFGLVISREQGTCNATTTVAVYDLTLEACR